MEELEPNRIRQLFGRRPCLLLGTALVIAAFASSCLAQGSDKQDLLKVVCSPGHDVAGMTAPNPYQEPHIDVVMNIGFAVDRRGGLSAVYIAPGGGIWGTETPVEDVTDDTFHYLLARYRDLEGSELQIRRGVEGVNAARAGKGAVLAEVKITSDLCSNSK